MSKNKELNLYNFVEISIDPRLLNNFSNEDSISKYFDSIAGTEEFQRLKQDLVEEVMNIINNNLTTRQKQVVIMTYLEGKTQNEISAILNIHQTAIHKSLAGNLDYTNSRKRYGGAIKKLKRLCSKNDKIKKILQEMKEKFEENI